MAATNSGKLFMKAPFATPSCLLMVLLIIMIGGAQLQATAAPVRTITCGTVTTTLAPCFEYVLRGGSPSPNCCTGVNSLYKSANTIAARRAVCLCLKSVTSTANPNTVNNAKTLPKKCGVSLPYEITPSIDCKSVN